MIGINKEGLGFSKGNRNGISSIYNIRCDPDIGVGKVAVRRISFTCISSIKQFELPCNNTIKYSNQKSYSVNKHFFN